MASDAETSKPKVTWNQKHTDFTIRDKSGNKFEVHKHILAENSPVFEAMLDQEMMETKMNKVEIKQFDGETINSFLGYIYAHCVKDEDTIGLLRAAVGVNKYIYKRPSFPCNKLTADLLGMAHYYAVEDLIADCSEHLKENICDENVIEVWTEARKFGMKDLSSAAAKHLAERPRGKPLNSVPGYEIAFGALDKPLKEFLDVLSGTNTCLEDENSQLKKDKKYRECLENAYIKITVSNQPYFVKANDKLSFIFPTLESKYGAPPVGYKLGLTKELSDNETPDNNYLQENLTFFQNGICTCKNTTLRAWHRPI